MSGKLSIPQIIRLLHKIIQSRSKVSLEVDYDGSGVDGFVVYVTRKRVESETDSLLSF